MSTWHPARRWYFVLTEPLSVGEVVILLVVLVFPVSVLHHHAATVDWRILTGIPLAASVFAYFAQRIDKHRAQNREWRISELTLHTAELLGGWPGSFIAQRRFQHKVSKESYQIVFWGIVLLHYLLAIDSLNSWKYTTKILAAANDRRPPSSQHSQPRGRGYR